MLSRRLLSALLRRINYTFVRTIASIFESYALEYTVPVKWDIVVFEEGR